MSGQKKDWKKFKEQMEAELENNSEENGADFTEEAAAAVNDQGALDHPSYTALEESLTLAEQKAHENWEKAVRATAELDNVRRRAERDVANAHRYGLEKLITSLLPVIDSLEQGIQMAENQADNQGMLEGLKLSQKLFLDVLEKFEVTQLNPVGEVFNPQEHEAMSLQEADAPANTVLIVFQKGYKLNDRVIRPARVIVVKNPG